MIKNLQIYLIVGLLISAIGASAQTEKGKSRLDIGKKPTVKTNQPITRYTIPASPSSTVNLNNKAVVNQYFRNALLGTPAKPVVTKKTNNESAIVSNTSEKSVAPENANSDKLFVNEKIMVSNIYPNPANDVAWIDYAIGNNVNAASISIYSSLGTEISTVELDKSERKVRISTANMDSGFYFYQLKVDGKKLATKKLLVRHN
jgi:hypothetical protein